MNDEKTLLIRLSKIVKRNRLARNLTQSDIAKSAGVHLVTIQRLEKAEGFPSFWTVVLLSRTLDFSFSELLDESPRLASHLTKLKDLLSLLATFDENEIRQILGAAKSLKDPTGGEGSDDNRVNGG